MQLFSELTGITANTTTRQPKEERPSDVFLRNGNAFFETAKVVLL